MVARDFRQALHIGRAWEMDVAEWLARKGYGVIPVFDTKARAPKMLQQDEDLTLPDILALRAPRDPVWVEVKWREEPSLHRVTGDWVGGINLRHWDQYLRVRDVTGWDVVLFYVVAGAGKVYVDTVSNLETYVHHRWQSMIYWDLALWPVDTEATQELLGC